MGFKLKFKKVWQQITDFQNVDTWFKKVLYKKHPYPQNSSFKEIHKLKQINISVYQKR